MTVDLIWLPQPVYSIPENKAMLIEKYLESAAVLIPEVLPAITNSEMIFKISSSMVVLQP
jgi:hypothetical protein